MFRPRQFELDFSHPLSRGLVFSGLGNLPFTKRMWDASQKRNHGTLTNMVPSSDWVLIPELGRWGLDLSGPTQRVDCGWIPTLASSITSSFSFAAWVRLTDTLTNNKGVLTNINTTNGYGVALTTSPSSTPLIGIRGRFGSTWASTYLASALAVGELAFVVGTYNGSRTQLYKNGVADNGTNRTGDIDYGAHEPTLLVGSAWYTTSGFADSNGITAMITDPMIYNRALSPAEIADLADPSNVYLSGLIKGRPRTTYFIMGDISTPSSPSFKPWFANRSHVL